MQIAWRRAPATAHSLRLADWPVIIWSGGIRSHLGSNRTGADSDSDSPHLSMTTPNDSISIRRLAADSTPITDSNRYHILWMRSGVDAVSIDFHRYPVEANTIFFVTPGQSVRFDCSHAAEGCIISISRWTFMEITRDDFAIRGVSLVTSVSEIPRIILSPKIGNRVSSIAEMIDELAGSEIPAKEEAIASLLRTLFIYCDSRCNIRIDHDSNPGKVQIVTEFKALVAANFTCCHKVKDYADMLNITPGYLNQVVREVLGVTAKSVIQEQLTIEARRELKFSNDSVKEIAFRLGFSEPFHFSTYFKKQMGYSPSKYRTL